MLIERLHLRNILSFRDTEVELRPLNVLIGANGSGKSNLFEVIALLQSAPTDLAAGIRAGGSFREWLWLGPDGGDRLSIDSHWVEGFEGFKPPEFIYPVPEMGRAQYRLELRDVGYSFEVLDELVKRDPFERFEGYELQRSRQLAPGVPAAKDLSPLQSMLRWMERWNGPGESLGIGDALRSLRLYREWNLGRETKVRDPQDTAFEAEALRPDFSNLAHVISRLRADGAIRPVEEMMRRFLPRLERIDTNILGGYAEIRFTEEGLRAPLPAKRMSDGTLRFLCLAVILLDPQPPSLICIEEPELGMHPHAMRLIVEMLRDAPTRTQVIITTHSPEMVHHFEPEEVLVTERDDSDGTQFQRLDSKRLKRWLKRYRLGELWVKGELGGTLW